MEDQKSLFDYFTIYLGRWFNVPLYLHWSWTLFLTILLFTNIQFVPTLIGAFCIIILHEFGHCIAAQYYKWDVHHIYLYPIGGAASMNFSPVPREEFVVAAAGPMVNVVLIGVFQVFEFTLLPQIKYINIAILLFNLLPIFPMDGGRLLRSSLQLWFSRVKATLIAARVGQVLCVGLAALGIYLTHIMLVLIAGFIALAAQLELEAVREQSQEQNDTDDLLKSSVDTLEQIQRKIDKHHNDFDR